MPSNLSAEGKMTIALSCLDPTPNRRHLSFISDILGSRELGQPCAEILLPHQTTAGRVQTAEAAISSVAQKTLVFGSTVLQYAGHSVGCEKVARTLYQLSKGGQKYYPLSEVYDHAKLWPNEREQTLAATYFFKPNGGCVACSHGFEKVSMTKFDRKYEIVGSGSGFSHFFEGIKSLPLTDETTLSQDVLYQIAMLICAPWFGDFSSFDQRYGSFFEYTTLGADGFKKHSVALKFWIRHEGMQKFSGCIPFA